MERVRQQISGRLHQAFFENRSLSVIKFDVPPGFIRDRKQFTMIQFDDIIDRNKMLARVRRLLQEQTKMHNAGMSQQSEVLAQAMLTKVHASLQHNPLNVVALHELFLHSFSRRFSSKIDP